MEIGEHSVFEVGDFMASGRLREHWFKNKHYQQVMVENGAGLKNWHACGDEKGMPDLREEVKGVGERVTSSSSATPSCYREIEHI
jgi:hypothetical protein